MYKCSECGCEYDIKPEFCDCGNDTFEKIETTDKIPVQETQSDIKTIKPVKLEVKHQEKFPNIQKKSFTEQYPGFSRFVSSIDPISGSIFGICILLSFIVIFFLWNVDENNITSPQPSPQGKGAISHNIPSIDKIWNSTPPAPLKEETKQEDNIKPAPIVQQVVKQIVPAQKPKINTTKKQTKQVTKTVTKPSAKKTQVNNSSAAYKQKTNISAPKQITQQKTTITNPAQKQTQNNTTVQTQPTQTKPQTGITTVTLQKNPAVSTIEQVNNTALKQELNNYKVSLRNTIGRKIDFTKVIGDGNCTVAFKIDSSGKLINRSFTKQSSNITLNDAVYAAVMSTPRYNAPPALYKNETLNLNIKFYNGNFEITLK